MPLESGTLIPELDDNNPLGSDGVSLGDDHIRLIKRAVTGSFPAFEGTTAVPKSVALTEDQINDAALKSEPGTVSADWTFSGAVTYTGSLVLENDVKLFGKDIGGTSRALATVNPSDVAVFGSQGLVAIFNALTQTSMQIVNVNVARFVDRASGSLLLWDAAGASSEAARLGGAAQTYAQRPIYSTGIRLANDKTIQGRNAADDDNFSLVKINSSNQAVFGSNNVGIGSTQNQVPAGFSHQFFEGANEPVRITNADAGSALVKDISGNFRKAGFRNPLGTNANASTTAIQAWEGQVIVCNAGSPIDITIDTLDGDTCYMMIVTGADVTLKKGAGTSTFQIQDGLNGTPSATDMVLSAGAAIQVYHLSGSTVRVWGNGYTVA